MINGNKKQAIHRAYVVNKHNGSDDGDPHEIGASWPHDDGKGFTIKLDALPQAGGLVLREPMELEKAKREDALVTV